MKENNVCMTRRMTSRLGRYPKSNRKARVCISWLIDLQTYMHFHQKYFCCKKKGGKPQTVDLKHVSVPSSVGYSQICGYSKRSKPRAPGLNPPESFWHIYHLVQASLQGKKKSSFRRFSQILFSSPPPNLHSISIPLQNPCFVLLIQETTLSLQQAHSILGVKICSCSCRFHLSC